jgi:hypothetical protein
MNEMAQQKSESTVGLEWHEAVDLIMPYVVRITTPQGSGTGFLVSRSTTEPIVGIATAAHVVDHAHYWEQPIRIQHHQSGKSVLLRPTERAILMEPRHDTAAIVFPNTELPLPVDPPKLIEERSWVKVGSQVGWLGFPAVSPTNLCFFSGAVSAWLSDEHAYLIDGVAINGVSGGPTLLLMWDHILVVGVVSAYIANRATGETLPGVSVVRDVSQFQALVRQFESLDEAKKEQAPVTSDPPPPAPDSSG